MSETTPTEANPSADQPQPRRRWLWTGVLGALGLAYGTITTFALGFIFPRGREQRRQRVFIGFAHEIGTGESKSLTLPSGDQMIVSNTGEIDPETGLPFLGFSNRCPHLGCRVHWDGKQRQFICPCHQGAFDASGVAVLGPPADAGQSLRPYRIEVDGKSMYAVVEDA